MISCEKGGGALFLKTFPFSVTCNATLRGFKPKLWPKYTDHSCKNVIVIQFSSILIKISELCFIA